MFSFVRVRVINSTLTMNDMNRTLKKTRARSRRIRRGSKLSSLFLLLVMITIGSVFNRSFITFSLAQRRSLKMNITSSSSSSSSSVKVNKSANDSSALIMSRRERERDEERDDDDVVLVPPDEDYVVADEAVKKDDDGKKTSSDDDVDKTDMMDVLEDSNASATVVSAISSDDTDTDVDENIDDRSFLKKEIAYAKEEEGEGVEETMKEEEEGQEVMNEE